MHAAWPQGLVDRISRLSEIDQMKVNVRKLLDVYVQGGATEYTLQQFLSSVEDRFGSNVKTQIPEGWC